MSVEEYRDQVRLLLDILPLRQDKNHDTNLDTIAVQPGQIEANRVQLMCVQI